MDFESASNSKSAAELSPVSSLIPAPNFWLGLLLGWGLNLLYFLILIPLSPVLLYLVFVRGRAVGSLRERFGFIEPAEAGEDQPLWIHAVSVGELEAAQPLLRELHLAKPHLPIVISTTTETAQSVIQGRLRKAQEPADDSTPSIRAFYSPLDFSFCVRRSLKRAKPSAVVLMELEIWPNMLLQCQRLGIPVYVANGRVSARGLSRTKKVLFLLGPFYQKVRHFLVQTEEYRQRLLELGVPAERLQIAGNLKYDKAMVDAPEAKRKAFEQRWGYVQGSLRWMAGCSHPGEEELILRVHKKLRSCFPGLSLILAPRHIERCKEVQKLCISEGMTPALSSADSPTLEPVILLVDQMGVLMDLYASADLAFVGGSLIERGGHNILEPILASTLALHGPNMTNFKSEVELLTTPGGSVQVASEEQLFEQLRALLVDSVARAQRLKIAQDSLLRHKGAAQRSAKFFLKIDLG